MHEMLQQLGMTDLWINITEIFMYMILIISGLIAISKQLVKAFKKLMIRLHKSKGINAKLDTFKKFSKWFKDAVKDGRIDDGELLLFDQMFNEHLTLHDVTDEDYERPITAYPRKYVDSSELDSDGDD